jgi:hypothetical protein
LEPGRGDALVDFLAVDPNVPGGLDRQPNSSAVDFRHADGDAAIDHDRFANFPR